MAKNAFGDEIITPSKKTNVFGDEIATPKSVAQPKPAEAAPKKTTGVMDSIYNTVGKASDEFGGAVVHTIGDMPLGIAQTIVDVNKAGRNAVLGKPKQTMSGLVSGKTDDVLQQASDYLHNKRQANDKEYQARVPDSAFSYAGRGLAEVAPWLLGTPVKAMQFVGGASKIIPTVEAGVKGLMSRTGQRVIGGAAQGGLAALVRPNANQGAGENLAYGMGMGGALPVGIATTVATGKTLLNGGKRIYDAVKNPAILAGGRILKEFGLDASTLPALENAKQHYPNQKVTVAESLSKTPLSAKAAAKQKELGNRGQFATAEEEMRAGNNEAEVAVFRKLAGTPEEKQAAQALLDERAGNWYKENIDQISQKKRYSNASTLLSDAKQKRISSADRDALNEGRLILNRVTNGKITPKEAQGLFKQLTVGSKTANDAIDQANLAMTEFQVKGKPILQQITKGQSSPSPVSNDIASFLESSLNKNDHTDEFGNMSTAKLQNVRKVLNGQFSKWIKDPAKQVSPQDYIYMRNVNATIDNAMERAVPGFKQAKSNYAQYSQVPNAQKASQGLIDKSIDNAGARVNSRHDAKLSPTDINRFLLSDMRKDYQMPSGAKKQVEGVLQSMRETAGTNSALKRNGSDTELNGFMGLLNKYKTMGMSATGGATLGGMKAGIPGAIVGGVAGGTAGALDARISAEMAKGVYDSRYAAKLARQYLDRYPVSQQQRILSENPRVRALMLSSALAGH